MEYQGIFWEAFPLKYIKLYIIRKTIFLGFQCFLFHENKLFVSKAIALLVTTYNIDRQIFSHFLLPLAQIFNQITFFTEIIATHSNSFNNP